VVQAVRILVVCATLFACDKSSRPSPAPGSGSSSGSSGSAAVAPVTIDAGIVAALADAGADASSVDAAPVECTAAAIGTARKEAQAQMKAGNYDAAIVLLRAPDHCYLETDQPEALQAQIAWRLSDLSFAYYKAGDFASCYAVASAESTPYAGNVGFFFGEEDAVVKALIYNATLCEQAAAKERGPFELASGKCTLVKDAFGLPTSALDGADRSACLVLGPDKKDEEDLNECGDVVLVRQSKKGKLSKTPLTVGEGNLSNGSVCCNVESISFGRRGANLAILVKTHGRDCNGGTASSEEQIAYELKGTTLEIFHVLAATAH
jgi:hypothetical protein